MAKFITDEDLFSLVAGVLKRGSNDVTSDAAYWRKLTETANEAAYNEIVTALAERGYTATQIAAWDRGAEFEKAIGTFWALDYGGCLGNYDDRLVTKLDRRAELKTVTVTTSNVVVTPAGEPTACGKGDLSTNKDLFVLDPNDSRIGEVTDW